MSATPSLRYGAAGPTQALTYGEWVRAFAALGPVLVDYRARLDLVAGASCAANSRAAAL
jgi:hypothetical protein